MARLPFLSIVCSVWMVAGTGLDLTDTCLAGAAGNLSALLLDESGQPLPGVFVTLDRQARDAGFPTLARTNQSGRVVVKDLAAGTYQLSIKSAEYRNPASRLVDILPERTAVVTLILQQLFDLGDRGENLGVKALLRSSGEQRLIFRGLPGAAPGGNERRSWLIEEAVVQVYSNGNPGGDYLIYPGDSWGGTTTNFAAVVGSSGTLSRHIVAGQLNSGSDSLWRIRNIVQYNLGEQHSVQLFMGYGRFSFEQPSLSLLSNPSATQEHGEFASLSGNSKLISLGVEDSIRLGSTLTVAWGVEVDQLRSAQTSSFISPSASLEFTPFSRTSVHLAMTAKPRTAGNTVILPDGEVISLATPLSISRISDETFFGTGRHLSASLSQSLGDGTSLELALFNNSPFGPSLPVFAFFETDKSYDFVHLSESMSRNAGWRVTAGRPLNENLKAQVSYLQGLAPALVAGAVSDLAQLPSVVAKRPYHMLSTQWEAFIPGSQTHLTALVRYVPGAQPLVTVDPLSDFQETGNGGVNFFVRQVIPVPSDVMKFFGLDFLAPPRIEALLDIRNLFNDSAGHVRSSAGEISLVQSPRSVRGGVSLRF